MRQTPILDLGPRTGPCRSAHPQARVPPGDRLLQSPRSLQPDARRRGDERRCASAASSGGNFGIAVAHAARAAGTSRRDLHSRGSASPEKVARIRATEEAEVTVVPGYYPEAAEACRARAKETGALLMHAYDHPDVVAGQGTVGIEIAAQVPGGRHRAGRRRRSGAHRRRRLRGSAARAGTSSASSRSYAPICMKPSAPGGRSTPPSVASRPTPWGRVASARSASRRHRQYVSESLLVTGRRHPAEPSTGCGTPPGLPPNPGGAASLAALLSGAYEPGAGESTCVAVICGANTEHASTA